MNARTNGFGQGYLILFALKQLAFGGIGDKSDFDDDGWHFCLIDEIIVAGFGVAPVIWLQSAQTFLDAFRQGFTWGRFKVVIAFGSVGIALREAVRVDADEQIRLVGGCHLNALVEFMALGGAPFDKMIRIKVRIGFAGEDHLTALFF